MSCRPRASRGTAKVCAQNENPCPATQAALLPLARLVLYIIREELSCELREEWIPHTRSPLGARPTRELARSGAFPGAKKHGRNWLIPRAALNAYVEHGGTAPPVVAFDRHPANDAAAAAHEDREVQAVLREHGLELKPQRARAARSGK